MGLLHLGTGVKLTIFNHLGSLYNGTVDKLGSLMMATPSMHMLQVVMWPYSISLTTRLQRAHVSGQNSCHR